MPGIIGGEDKPEEDENGDTEDIEKKDEDDGQPSCPQPHPSWSQRWRRCHGRGLCFMPGIIGAVDTPAECYEFLCGSTPPIVSRVT